MNLNKQSDLLSIILIVLLAAIMFVVGASWMHNARSSSFQEWANDECYPFQLDALNPRTLEYECASDLAAY